MRIVWHDYCVVVNCWMRFVHDRDAFWLLPNPKNAWEPMNRVCHWLLLLLMLHEAFHIPCCFTALSCQENIMNMLMLCWLIMHEVGMSWPCSIIAVVVLIVWWWWTLNDEWKCCCYDDVVLLLMLIAICWICFCSCPWMLTVYKWMLIIYKCHAIVLCCLICWWRMMNAAFI